MLKTMPKTWNKMDWILKTDIIVIATGGVIALYTWLGLGNIILACYPGGIALGTTLGRCIPSTFG